MVNSSSVDVNNLSSGNDDQSSIISHAEEHGVG